MRLWSRVLGRVSVTRLVARVRNGRRRREELVVCLEPGVGDEEGVVARVGNALATSGRARWEGGGDEEGVVARVGKGRRRRGDLVARVGKGRRRRGGTQSGIS